MHTENRFFEMKLTVRLLIEQLFSKPYKNNNIFYGNYYREYKRIHM